MTVICNILTKNEVIVGSDGYITLDGKPVQSDAVKFIKFDHPNCVVAYWGLATYRAWSMRGWLKFHKQHLDRHPDECKTLVDFAFYLKGELDKTRGIGGALRNVRDKGIGLHVIGFVPIEKNIKIPELYLITNYSLDKDGKYWVNQDTLDCTPRTIRDFIPDEKSDLTVEEKRRHIYDQILNNGKVIIYNNGDPVLFNDAFHNLAKSKKSLPTNDISKADYYSHLQKMVAEPIEEVKNHQSKNYSPENVAVGGRVSTGILLNDGTWLPS